MSNPVASFIAEGAASTTSFFTHENFMDLLLITIPTLILAIVTLWDNERMYKITMAAIERLRPRRRRAHKALHGRHERVVTRWPGKTIDSEVVPAQPSAPTGHEGAVNHPKTSVGSNFLTKFEPEE